MNNNYFTPDIERGYYERVIAVLAAQMGLTREQFITGFKVMPQTLKLAVALDPGVSSYALSPRKGVNNPTVPNTVLLDFNDFFGITGIGLRLGRADIENGALTNHGNYPLLTYVDPEYFNNVGNTKGSEAASLLTLMNGTTGISVNNDSQVDAICNQELMFNGQSPYSITNPSLPQFGGSDGQRGIMPLTPQIILDASADNNIIVNVGNGAKANIDGSENAAAATTTRNLLYVMLYGIKVKNLSGAGNAAACKV